MTERQPVGLELYGCVKSADGRIGAIVLQALDRRQEYLADSEPPCFLTPDGRCASRVSQLRYSVDKDNWFPIHSNVTRVSQHMGQPSDMRPIIIGIRDG